MAVFRNCFMMMLLWLFFNGNIFAQNGNQPRGNYFDKLKQVTESGRMPQKASLGSDLYSAVNTLTGAVCFDIPIYTIKVSGYELPVTLRYETSGFKLVDIPSNVGIGWNIVAGGSITRTIKGCHDDLKHTGYKSQYHTADSIHQYFLELAEREDFDTLGQNPPQEDISLFAALLDITDNLIDSEPDIYTFNFADYSGSFVFDMNGTPHLIPEQNFRIQGTDTTYYVITVDNGDKYYFGGENATETVNSTYNCPLAMKISRFEIANANYYYNNRYVFRNDATTIEAYNNYNIAWHLTRIDLAESGQTILFEYDSDDVRTYIGTDESYMIGRGYYNAAQTELEPGHDWIVHRTNRYRFSHVPRLRRINWDNGSIEFLPSDSYREDLDYSDIHDQVDFGGRSIEKIKVYSLEGDNGTRDHFSVDLRHSYIKNINTTVSPPNGIPLQYRSYYKRLCLDTLVFNDKNDVKIYEYAFHYNLYDTMYCRSRNSCEIDCWGYFKPRTATFIERFPIKPQLFYYENGKSNPLYNSVYSVWRRSGEVEPTCVFDGYSDMMPDSVGAKEFTLRSIKLPTGGLVSFDYELNDFHFDDQDIKGPGVRVKTVFYDSGDGNCFNKQYLYKENAHSSGKIAGIPNIGLYTYIPRLAFGEPSGASDCGRQNYLTSRQVSTVSDMGGSSSASVLYEKVTEICANDSCNMGKTIYYYQTNFTASDSVLMAGDEVFVKKTHCRKSHAFMTPPNSGYQTNVYIGHHLDAAPDFTQPVVSWYNGIPTKTEYYDNENNLVESLEYKYSLNPKNDSILYIQSKFLEKYTDTWMLYSPLFDITDHVPIYQYDILWGVNYYKTGTRQLDSIVKRRYDAEVNGLANQLIEIYAYNIQNYVSERTTLTSDGSVLQTHFTYPVNYAAWQPNSVYHDMMSRNMLRNVIEQYTTIDGKVSEGSFIEYELTDYGGFFIKPEKQYTLRTDTPLTDFHPSFSQPSIDSRYKLFQRLYYSPLTGNVVEIKNENEGTTAFVWGYNYYQLLAVIKNATAQEVRNALPCTESVLQETTDSDVLCDIFRTLRTSLPQAMVTSYTYDLFGNLTSVTDPSGKKKSFGYDSAFRLKLIRDSNDKILQKYEYHYKP